MRERAARLLERLLTSLDTFRAACPHLYQLSEQLALTSTSHELGAVDYILSCAVNPVYVDGAFWLSWRRRRPAPVSTAST